jgi:uncharacterized protein
MAYFVVINEQGPAWVPGRSMRDQAKWTEHAAFMNAVTAEGLVVLGGPIRGAGTHRARLIVKAASEAEMTARLAEDPWMRMGMLRTVSVEPWEVLLSKDG